MRPLVAHALCLAFWCAAVAPGIAAVWHVDWHYDLDGFRDVAMAEGLRNGRGLADPFYAGELTWYGPMVPTLVAAVAGAFDLPTSRTLVQLGAWLNALPPLAFYACATRLFGPWAALAATFAFLFLPVAPFPWEASTYTPWLFSAIAAQTAFYLGLLAWLAALARPAAWRAAVVGLALGAGFLTQPAPALLLGGIMGVTTLVPAAWPAGVGWRRRSTVLAVACGVGLALSAIAWLPLALRYGMKVHNRLPPIWIWDAIQPEQLLPRLFEPAGLPVLALALAGALAAWRRTPASPRAVAAAWGAVAAGLMGYALAAERLQRLPPLVSAYHFFFQLRAWQWLVFGAGCAFVAAWLARLAGKAWKRPVSPHVVLAAGLVVAAAALYPRYLGREAFTQAPKVAQEIAARPDERHTREWIRMESPDGAVFAASDQDSYRIVGPAGRCSVCIDRLFSNPYVDYTARAAARDGMFQAAECGDDAGFREIARPFGVTHVLARGDQAQRIEQNSSAWTRRTYQAHGVAIFAIVER